MKNTALYNWWRLFDQTNQKKVFVCTDTKLEQICMVETDLLFLYAEIKNI